MGRFAKIFRHRSLPLTKNASAFLDYRFCPFFIFARHKEQRNRVKEQEEQGKGMYGACYAAINEHPNAGSGKDTRLIQSLYFLHIKQPQPGDKDRPTLGLTLLVELDRSANTDNITCAEIAA